MANAVPGVNHGFTLGNARFHGVAQGKPMGNTRFRDFVRFRNFGFPAEPDSGRLALPLVKPRVNTRVMAGSCAPCSYPG